MHHRKPISLAAQLRTLAGAVAILPMLFSAPVSAAVSAAIPDPSTLDGKVLFGYQGWFDCPGLWGGNWSHWAGGAPSANNLGIEMYPDLSDFPKSDLCLDQGLTVGADPAYFFSARNPNVTDMHFKWMMQYGLDGVLIQRFVSDIPGLKANGDKTLKNIIASSAKYGRVIAIEYDVTGSNFNTWAQDMENDWKYLVDQLKITAQPNYLHHKGRPLVSVWGIGLNESRNPPTNPADALTMLNWFHTTAAAPYQASIMAGAPAGFRTLSRDARTDAGWLNVWKASDAVQPWNVGRYNGLNQVKSDYDPRTMADQTWLAAAGVTYMPVIFPGYSFYNADHAKPQNEIARLGGRFLWSQAMGAATAKAGCIKIAMFDEVNEGTAMFKVVSKRSQAPSTGFWLALDADGADLPSDWYLRLAGEITKITHGEQAPTDSIPIKPTDPYVVGMRALIQAMPSPWMRWHWTGDAMEFQTGMAAGKILISDLQGREIRALKVESSGGGVTVGSPGRLAPGAGGQASGMAWWDLRDGNGQWVRPGMVAVRCLSASGLQISDSRLLRVP